MAAQEAAEQDWIPEDSFRNRLGVVRVALGGLNIKEAATLCGINPESWRRWEDGKSPRDLESICAQIHRATGIDYRWLIGGGPLGGQNLKFLTLLDTPPDIAGQCTFLDAAGEPLDFYSRAELVSVPALA